MPRISTGYSALLTDGACFISFQVCNPLQLAPVHLSSHVVHRVSHSRRVSARHSRKAEESNPIDAMLLTVFKTAPASRTGLLSSPTLPRCPSEVRSSGHCLRHGYGCMGAPRSLELNLVLRSPSPFVAPVGVEPTKQAGFEPTASTSWAREPS